LTYVVQSAFELQATSAGVKAHVSAAASGSSEKVYSVQVAGKASGISASRMSPVPPSLPESEPLPAEPLAAPELAPTPELPSGPLDREQPMSVLPISPLLHEHELQPSLQAQNVPFA